jgi:DNA repair protein RadC
MTGSTLPSFSVQYENQAMNHQLNLISAASIKLVHNHPAGDPTPSKEGYLASINLAGSASIILAG